MSIYRQKKLYDIVSDEYIPSLRVIEKKNKLIEKLSPEDLAYKDLTIKTYGVWTPLYLTAYLTANKEIRDAINRKLKQANAKPQSVTFNTKPPITIQSPPPPPPPPAKNHQEIMAEILEAAKAGKATEQMGYDFAKDLLKASNALIDAANKLSFERLSSYEEARGEIDKLIKEVVEIGVHFRVVGGKPEQLLLPEGPSRNVVKLVRDTLPVFDPVARLKIDFGAIRGKIEASQKFQEKAVQEYTKFDARFDDLMKPFFEMDQILKEGISTLEKMNEDGVGDKHLNARILTSLKATADAIIIHITSLKQLEMQGDWVRNTATATHAGLTRMDATVTAASVAVTTLLNLAQTRHVLRDDFKESATQLLGRTEGAISDFASKIKAQGTIPKDMIPGSTIAALPAPETIEDGAVETSLPLPALPELLRAGLG